MGLAPVIVDYAGPGELVSAGTGFTIPLGRRPEIVRALRATLERLAGDPVAVARAGAAARARVEALFTWDREGASRSPGSTTGCCGIAPRGHFRAVRPGRSPCRSRAFNLAIWPSVTPATDGRMLHPRHDWQHAGPAAPGLTELRLGGGGLTHSLGIAVIPRLDAATRPESGSQMSNQYDIAIVGMAAHLPGARSIEAYWANLRDGVESIRRLSEDELLAAGETPDRLHNRNYVRAAAPLDGFEMFDGEFFGFSPKEAAIMDPQHRQFLEVAWEALENAGHPPESVRRRDRRLRRLRHGQLLLLQPAARTPTSSRASGMFLLRHTGNDKDFLATRVSHVLDLKGPSVNVQTACSTSLVAVHFACQALLSGECDMALAGGVTIELPHGRGYLFKEGEILSPDGHCHAFDHRAAGHGLRQRRRRRRAAPPRRRARRRRPHLGRDQGHRGQQRRRRQGRLPRAERRRPGAGDRRGACGRRRHRRHHRLRRVPRHRHLPRRPDRGGGADRRRSARPPSARGFCRIGSVKTNIGHLDTAAGVASLIKAALALHHRRDPAEPRLRGAEPGDRLRDEPVPRQRPPDRLAARDGPRRAGVNSLGVGGTNAHAVLEEAPRPAASEAFGLAVPAADALGALARRARRQRQGARRAPRASIPSSRSPTSPSRSRRAGAPSTSAGCVVAASHEEAAALLEAGEPRRVFTHSRVGDAPEVVFMFPGGGAQYAGMARDLYETEPVFARLDRPRPRGAAAEARLRHPRRSGCPRPGAEAEAAERLKRPSVQLPLIMIVEYALAQLWMSWGVKPAALVGHSMGENTAACLAGVMSFEDCVGLVHLRGAALRHRARRRHAERAAGGGGPRAAARRRARPRQRQRPRAQRRLGTAGGARRARRRGSPPTASSASASRSTSPRTRACSSRSSAASAPTCRSIRLAPADDPVRLQPHRPLHHRRRGDRSRLLGRAPARHRALRRLHLRRSPQRPTASTSRSAPARR